MDEDATGWRDVTGRGRGELHDAATRERDMWLDWLERGFQGTPPKSLIPQFRWVVEKLLRRLEPSVVDEDLCIARKIQTECTQRARAILEASGPQRDTPARIEARRRLRDKAKRLSESVQTLRREVAQHEKSGLIPETAVAQVKVELEAEKRVLEDRLRDWTRQLEAGRMRIEQIDEAVDRVKKEMQLETERHAQTMPELRSELARQQSTVQHDLQELREFEEQAEPVVTAYQKLQADIHSAAAKSQEWREELLRVAGSYSEEIQRLSTSAMEIQALPSSPDVMRTAGLPGWSPSSVSPSRPAVSPGAGGYPSPPVYSPPSYQSPGSPAPAKGPEVSPLRPSPKRSPGRGAHIRADQHVAELSLIHSEALRTTDMLEREIDALRDAVRGSPGK